MRNRTLEIIGMLVSLLLTLSLIMPLGLEAVAVEAGYNAVLPEPVLPTGTDIIPEGICLGPDPRYTYDHSSGSQEFTKMDAAEAIADSLEKQETDVDIAKFTIPVSEFGDLMTYVSRRYPELFAVDFSAGYSYFYNPNNNCITKLTPKNYTMSGTAYQQAQEKYRGYIEEIISLVNPEWSRIEKILFLNDYIATHYCYDDSLTIYDAYNFLDRKTGVCQSYTLTMEALLDELKVPVSYVRSSNLAHVWNMVQLEDGNWYHLDVTWNDPTRPDRINYAGHKNFILSDAEMSNHIKGSKDWSYGTPGDTPWSSESPCTSTTYDDWFWRESISPFVNVNDKWYYITGYTQEGGVSRIYEWDGEASVSTEFMNPKRNCMNTCGLNYRDGYFYYTAYDTIEAACLSTKETVTLSSARSDNKIYVGSQINEPQNGKIAVRCTVYDFDTKTYGEETVYVDEPINWIAKEGYRYSLLDNDIKIEADTSTSVIIASYSSSQKLLDMQVCGKSTQQDFTIYADSDYVKLIAVNSNMKPVCASETITPKMRNS